MRSGRLLPALLAASCAVVAVGCGGAKTHTDPVAPDIPPLTTNRL